MKKINLYSIVFAFSLLFSSCESELEVKGVGDITPHLVLNTLLYAENDTCRLYVTETRSVFRQVWDPVAGWFGHSNFAHIKDAGVSLAINDRSDSLPYHERDSSFLLLQKLRTGDAVEVEVAHRNRRLKGAAVIPEAPEIIQVDTISFTKEKEGSYAQNFLKFSVTLKDNGKQRNFYRLYVTRGNYYLTSWDEEKDGDWYYNHDFSTEDPVLTQGYPSEEADIEIGAYTRNRLGIFTNDLFKGDTYTMSFNIYRPEYAYGGSYYGKNSTRIAIQAISEDLYYYYQSIQRDYGNDETTCEPVVIYSNIKDGLGIVGAIHEKVAFYEEIQWED